MTLGLSYAPSKALGNGTTVTFTASGWQPISANFIKVYFENVATGVITEQVSGFTKTALSNGASVTFTAPPPNTVYVIITREPPLSQDQPYKTSQGWQGDKMEDSLDKLTAITQKLNNDVSRAVKLKLASSSVVTIDEPSTGELLAWNSDGNLENTGVTATQLINAATSSAASAATATTQAGIATTQAGIATTAATNATNAKTAAEAARDDAMNIVSTLQVTPLGATKSRSLAEHLSGGGRVFHSKDFTDIDHTGVLDSASGVQKLLNKAGNPNEHTVIYLDAGTIKIGNNVPANSAVVGGLTITDIRYNGVSGQVRVDFTNSSTLNSSTITAGLATGSSFLTIEGAANDANNGIFTMLSWSDTINDKHVIISTPRTNNSLDETGLNLTTSANRIRIAGPQPLFYRSNCTIIINCDLVHNFNSGKQHLMCGYNIDVDGGARSSDVHLDMSNGGMVVFPDLGPPTPSKKGIAFTFTDRFSVIGYRSRGNDRGSFDFQIRDCSNGWVMGSIQKSGDSVGEDGVHLIRNCRDITISNLVTLSGDDSLSFTQESSSVPYVIENITVANCILRTSNNSSFKCLVDSTAAAGGAKIRNINVSNCHFGVHNNSGAGTLVRVSSVNGYEEAVSDITFTNCTTDNIGDGTGALSSTSIRFDYVSRCCYSDGIISDHVRNAVIINGGKDCVFENNLFCRPAPQTSVTNVTGLTVTDIVQSAGTSFVATFSGSPDLSTVGTTFTTITFTSGTTNFLGTFELTGVNNTTKTATFTVPTNKGFSSFNETSISAAAYIRKQAGEVISLAGGLRHKIQGNSFIGSYVDSTGRVVCAGNAILAKTNSATGQVPVGHVISDNDFTDFVVSTCVFLQNGEHIAVKNNTATDCTCRNMILEASGTLGNNVFLDNSEYGAVKTPISYHFSKSTSLHRGNVGSNSDTVTGTVTITASNTSTTINVPNHYGAPTGASPAMGWTQGFNAGDPAPRNLRLTPTTSYGSAKQEHITYNSGTRNYTITLDSNPGSDVTWAYELNAN